MNTIYMTPITGDADVVQPPASTVSLLNDFQNREPTNSQIAQKDTQRKTWQFTPAKKKQTKQPPPKKEESAQICKETLLYVQQSAGQDDDLSGFQPFNNISFDRHVSFLDISGLGLTHLDHLHLERQFPCLITLVVSNNRLTSLPNDSFFVNRKSNSSSQLWCLDFSRNDLEFSGTDQNLRPLALMCPVLGVLNLEGNPRLTADGVQKMLSGLIVADLFLPQEIVGPGNVASEVSKYLALKGGTSVMSSDVNGAAAIGASHAQTLISILDVLGGCLAVNGYCLPLATPLQAKRYELVQQSIRSPTNQWRPQRDLLRVLHRRNAGDASAPLDEARELLTCFICANENLKMSAVTKETTSESSRREWEIPGPHRISTGLYAFNIHRSFWHQAPVQWAHWKVIDDNSSEKERFSYVFVHVVAAAAECQFLDRETLAIICARLIDEELVRQQRKHEVVLNQLKANASQSHISTPLLSNLGDSPANGSRKSMGGRRTPKNSSIISTPVESSLTLGDKKFTVEDEEIIAQLAGDVLAWPTYVLQFIAHRLCIYRQMPYPYKQSDVDVMIVHKHVQLALTDEAFSDLVRVSPEFERRVKCATQAGAAKSSGKGKKNAPPAPTAEESMLTSVYRSKLFSHLNGTRSIRDTLQFVSDEPKGASAVASFIVHSEPPSGAGNSPSQATAISPTRNDEAHEGTFLTLVRGFETDQSQTSPSKADDDNALAPPLAAAVPVVEEPLLGSENVHPKGLVGCNPAQLNRLKEREHKNREISESNKTLKSDINYKNAVMRQPPLRIPRPSSCLAIQQHLQDEQNSRIQKRAEGGAEPSDPLYHNHNTVLLRSREAPTPTAHAHDTSRHLSEREKLIASMTLEEFLQHEGVKGVCGDQRLILSVLDDGAGEPLDVEARLRAIFEKDPTNASDTGNATAKSETGRNSAPLFKWPTPNYRSPFKRRDTSRSSSSAGRREESERGRSHSQQAVVNEFMETTLRRRTLHDSTPHFTANTTNPESWEPVTNAVRLLETSSAAHPFTSQAAETMRKLRERHALKRRTDEMKHSAVDKAANATACSSSLRNIRVEHRKPDSHQFLPVEVRRELEKRRHSPPSRFQ